MKSTNAWKDKEREMKRELKKIENELEENKEVTRTIAKERNQLKKQLKELDPEEQGGAGKNDNIRQGQNFFKIKKLTKDLLLAKREMNEWKEKFIEATGLFNEEKKLQELLRAVKIFFDFVKKVISRKVSKSIEIQTDEIESMNKNIQVYIPST